MCIRNENTHLNFNRLKLFYWKASKISKPFEEHFRIETYFCIQKQKKKQNNFVVVVAEFIP